MRIKLTVLAALLVLAGCSNSGNTAEVQDYPYFTSMPSPQTFEEKYENLRHTLSPITRYHYRIAIPKDWETLDIILDKEPEPGAFAEMGVFRQPGAWMNGDQTAAQEGEITITAVNAQGNDKWASVWMKDIVETNVPNVQILEERTVKNGSDEAIDMLFSYKDNERTIFTRMSAFRKGDRFFVISVSDSANGYRDTAEAFYVAIATFILEEDSKANPFYLN